MSSEDFPSLWAVDWDQGQFEAVSYSLTKAYKAPGLHVYFWHRGQK